MSKLSVGEDSGSQTPIVEMRGIVKRFPGVLANDHIDFELKRGEVHALLGENGAGKTTLMNILYGLCHPDEGQILVDAVEVQIRSPRDAIDLGIGMVHQHFKLVLPHTVTENIILGLSTPRFFLNIGDAKRKITELSMRYRLKVDPEARIWQLSMGERQRVEILKLLFREAQVLILDEPTSVLTPQEADDLFQTLTQMAKEGRSTILITHKLDEAMAVSDRVTVLRRGRVVATRRAAETGKAELAEMMVGRSVLFELSKKRAERGRIALEVRGVRALNDTGLPALKGVFLSISEGEVLGIAGVAGNGQRELAEVVTGMRRVEEGKILLYSNDVTNKSPRFMFEKGVAYIPEERIGVALVQGLSVCENLVFRSYRYRPFSNYMFLNEKVAKDFAQNLVEEFEVVTPSLDTPTRHLSGGNLQKLLLARELSRRPKIIVAVDPSRGLDVKAAEYVRRVLLQCRENGSAILLVSEDLDEILAVSDRIAVMYEGRVMGIMPIEEADVERVGLMMAGSLDMVS